MHEKAKQRVVKHLIDQDGIQLLRAKLPRHWVLREYRPDYGLDFSIEAFSDDKASSGFETLAGVPSCTLIIVDCHEAHQGIFSHNKLI